MIGKLFSPNPTIFYCVFILNQGSFAAIDEKRF